MVLTPVVLSISGLSIAPPLCGDEEVRVLEEVYRAPVARGMPLAFGPGSFDGKLQDLEDRNLHAQVSNTGT